MVCLGNICRSPTAHGVFQHRIESAGLEEIIKVDSAGTGDYHVGEKPDKRARTAAKRRGYSLGGLRARQVQAEDFERFDYILAMDDNNLRDLTTLCPKPFRHKLKLLMDFADNNYSAVPDPYYGKGDAFELVLNLVEEASNALLEHIKTHDLNG
ncbi:MAG: low molecular weight protein-tyrosine-phosphatase [Gammaproteobacteria bacterium]|nr:low molecular weight protein-tyrosine-phosphatase [Gammaproteobacteria bacterium]MDP2141356.1 low molecular weight protein-tyrosine-phosphatase [Gammaproteobacteria bacterium]MDP2349057.1 low molecular weight protein-tyrosine-phosphatase [Gammaproteobacteria bacterium]